MGKTRVMLRLVGAWAIVAAFTTTGSVGAQGTDEKSRVALFVTLPMTNGFADATEALVETQHFVHEALEATEAVRLVDRLQDSDVVVTVLGRGTGYMELTAALQGIDASVVAPPVMLHAQERYIEAMLTVGACGDAETSATRESASPSCYRKIIVGVGDHEVRHGVTRTATNSWTTCADALARDVQAWVTQNASRLLARRG
jgi:hypothetical protein